MRTRSTPGLVAALLLAFASTAQSQTSRSDPVDFHTRYGVAVNADLPKRWVGTVDYELRLVDNSSTYRGSYFTGEIGRNKVLGMTLYAGYRLASVTTGTFHRFSAGAQRSRKVGATTLSLRTQLQHQQKSFHDEEQATDEDTFLRVRLRAKHPLGERVAAFVSVEPYFTFAGEYPIDNWRNTCGIQISYAKGKRLDLYYIYRPDYAKSYNRTFHTLGIEHEFDVKLPRR